MFSFSSIANTYCILYPKYSNVMASYSQFYILERNLIILIMGNNFFTLLFVLPDFLA